MNADGEDVRLYVGSVGDGTGAEMEMEPEPREVLDCRVPWPRMAGMVDDGVRARGTQ